MGIFDIPENELFKLDEEQRKINELLVNDSVRLLALEANVLDLQERIEALESNTTSPPIQPSPVEIPHGTLPGGVPDWLNSDNLKLTFPPSGFRAAKPWLNIIYDPNQNGPAIVTIESLSIKGIVNNRETILGNDVFAQTKLLSGGRWQRYINDNPTLGLCWFCGGSLNIGFTGLNFNNDGVTIDVERDKNRIWHCLMWNRVWLPNNLQRAWVEATVKITGAACVHVGLDFWRDLTSGYAGKDVNNTEASWSKWYFSRKDKMKISVGRP